MERTTAWGVPPGNRGGSTDIWECRQILEDLVTFGQQTVGSVRARDRGKRLWAIVVNWVPRDAGGASDERSDKESDDGDELHVCDCRKTRVLFA